MLFDQGADIIYAAAGKGGLGAIDQVKSRPGAYVIGVDSDQDALVPGKILTSMVKRVDIGVFAVSQDAAARRPRPTAPDARSQGGRRRSDRFRLHRKRRDAAEDRAMLDTLRAAIIAGKIVVPSTREELASFKRVPL